MLLITLWSLLFWITPFFRRVVSGDLLFDTFFINGMGATALFVLALLLVISSGKVILGRPVPTSNRLTPSDGQA
jgi:hypothetical protein